jgi:PiT family inorganic phosphate transporter
VETAALLVVGILIDIVLAVATILLFARSRRAAVTAADAMSETADPGHAVKGERNPPPTRRQRAIMREEARRRADLEAKERAKRRAQARAEAKAEKDAGAAAKAKSR